MNPVQPRHLAAVMLGILTLTLVGGALANLL
ncbi:hypothetical protein HNQ09_000726 [Deinococcus budaensis]|uniref:Uncharacterized protein n=1 Tax=Deinococcus budaensis TaxID=1665626 RepID=A0A7W8GD95_9DEIO|nr:hypothetical protein [Deinococcus budaensis]